MGSQSCVSLRNFPSDCLLRCITEQFLHLDTLKANKHIYFFLIIMNYFQQPQFVS
jgi:hypothetical protein